MAMNVSFQPHAQRPPSPNNPHRAAYNRSNELRRQFGDPALKYRRKIPNRVRGSFSTGCEYLPDRFTSTDSLHNKRLRLAAEVEVKTATPQTPLTPSHAAQIGARTRIQYGRTMLNLKTEEERKNITPDGLQLLRNFHPAGSEMRDRQLEFFLCPVRCHFGFSDDNGYWPSVNGHDPNDDGVTYRIGNIEQASMMVVPKKPAVDEENGNSSYPKTSLYPVGYDRSFGLS